MIQTTNLEKSLPWLLAALGAGIVFAGIAAGIVSAIGGLSQLFDSSINVAGIAIGFLATMKAILLSLKQSRTVRVLRTTNRWSSVLIKIRRAIIWLFLSAMTSVVLLIVDPRIFSASPTLTYIGLMLWGFLSGGAVGASFLVIDILFTIVEEDDRRPNEPSPAPKIDDE